MIRPALSAGHVSGRGYIRSTNVTGGQANVLARSSQPIMVIASMTALNMRPPSAVEFGRIL